MFCHDKSLVYPAFFDDFQECDASSEALDEFKSAIIIAYEQALEGGMSSSAAFAAVLDLLSAEFKRCVHLNG
jgi:hypothetical protein